MWAYSSLFHLHLVLIKTTVCSVRVWVSLFLLFSFPFHFVSFRFVAWTVFNLRKGKFLRFGFFVFSRFCWWVLVNEKLGVRLVSFCWVLMYSWSGTKGKRTHSWARSKRGWGKGDPRRCPWIWFTLLMDGPVFTWLGHLVHLLRCFSTGGRLFLGRMNEERSSSLWAVRPSLSHLKQLGEVYLFAFLSLEILVLWSNMDLQGIECGLSIAILHLYLQLTASQWIWYLSLQKRTSKHGRVALSSDFAFLWVLESSLWSPV